MVEIIVVLRMAASVAARVAKINLRLGGCGEYGSTEHTRKSDEQRFHGFYSQKTGQGGVLIGAEVLTILKPL